MAIEAIDPTTYKCILPNGDEVEIGDKEATSFKPHLKLNRWGKECFIKLSLPTASKYPPLVEGETVKWVDPDIEVQFYELEANTIFITKDKDGKDVAISQNENGAFEFEITLIKKPPSNKVTLDLETQGLRFNYQPALTQAEVNEGTTRPENVVGSYAVYHADRKNIHRSKSAAEKYKTCKAFHIYRPKVIDNNGDWIWGDLNIDVPSKHLIITIDQDWLDQAAYPVVIDPTIGDTGIGATNYNLHSYGTMYRRGSAWTMSEDGTADDIKAYLGGDGVENVKAFINQKDSGGAGTHAQIATQTNAACAQAWHWETFTLGSEALANGVTYIINALGWNSGGSNYYQIKGDHDGALAVASYSEIGNYGAPESPWVVNPEGTTVDYSIYVDYTAGGGGGIADKSAGMGAKMIAGKMI